MTDINTLVDIDDIEASNSAADIKSKFLSLADSLRVIDEEKECMKDIIKDLKANFDIEPKCSRIVAKCLHDPEKLREMEDLNNEVTRLVSQILKNR